MTSIDDPLETVKSQYPEEPANQPFEIALQVLSAINPLVAVGNGLRQHFSLEGMKQRVRALFEAFESEIRRHEKQIDEIRTRLESPEFIETLIVAVNKTVETANRKKIQNFASILGYQVTVGEGRKAWEETSAFIRDIAELGETDIEALHILHSVQKNLFAGAHGITDPNPFTETIQAVLSEVDKRKIPRDDFYSRCARLYGFGLAFEVERNQSRMAPRDHCFRLTLRGKRLLSMLQEDNPGPA